MKIEIGGLLGNSRKGLAGDRVIFVVNDEQVMFEVRIGDDGKSIEVRGVESCQVGKVLYSERLMVSPNCANYITISTKRYDE